MIDVVIPSEVEESRGKTQRNFAGPSTPGPSAQDDRYGVEAFKIVQEQLSITNRETG